MMKQHKLMYSLLAGSLLLLQACNKSDSATTTANQTVEAGVSRNGTYSYTLPASTGQYRITTPASHALTSGITTDNNGAAVYQYAPATDYTGTDAVVVSSAEAAGGRGDCGNGAGTTSHVVTFRIAVTDNTTGSSN